MIFRRHPKRRLPTQTLSIKDFSLGLNTFAPPTELEPGESSVLKNWRIIKGGKIVNRYPIKKYSDTAITGSIVVSETIKIGATEYVLLQGSDYKLYYLSTLTPTLIGSLTSQCELLPYNGVAIIFDGSFVKYMDDVSEIKICYDDSTGSAGCQFDYTSKSDDSTLDLDGTNLRIGQKFTSQAWTTGYTIPPTTVTAILSKTGSPTGDLIAKIRLVSDDSVLATKTMVVVATLTTVATSFSVTFATSDITTELSPSTDYYCSLEHTGTATDYVSVHCVDQTGLAYYYTTLWVADAAKDCLMRVQPGMPPKASFGRVKDQSLWAGGDPDNPGYIWKSNLTHLIWSGYVGIVDENKDSYPCGAIELLYGDLLVYGTENHPYISKLTGSSMSDWALQLTYQKSWSTSKTLVSVVNDLWAGSGDGVNPISGVKEYGDLRTSFASDPVQDKIDNYWNSDTAFASYYPRDGQYWLVMPTYRRVLCCHTKIPVRMQTGIRYPWTEYEFYNYDLTDQGKYKWRKSANGTNEYYVELLAGGDPSISRQPDFITRDGVQKAFGTLGSLGDQEAGYGDNDSLGYSTVYFADAAGSPVLVLTNKIVWSNDLTNSKWQQVRTPTPTLVSGLDATHSATRITDNNVVKDEYIYQSVALTAPLPPMLARIFIEKQTSATANCQVIIEPEIGGATEHNTISINVQAGMIIKDRDDTGTLAYKIIESAYNSDFWEILISTTPGDATNTACKIVIDPAWYDLDTIVGDATNTGFATVGNVELYLNATIADIEGTDPVFTTSSASEAITTSGHEILSIQLPTSMSRYGADFLLGSSDGFLYTLNTSGYKDQTTVQIRPEWKGPIITLPFGYSVFSEMQIIAESKTGTQFDLNFLVDGSQHGIKTTQQVNLPLTDNVTVDDLTMTVDDALFTVSYLGNSLFASINFNANAIMCSIDNMKIIGNPIYFDGILLRYRRLSF